ncbi:TauD/TfdA family dioxygenase [Acinetobacter kyonggiensis]|uniref:Taurine catabolism dioxygenase TauD, TfdA family n=1 Tax=Acinetobacter kyonggiensis TaxID=595670 RepID=A0A1H3KFY7_9GAMM|nr:TauD/TfdA family dioxygenase [Acinetobacter kyonggiensis]SDY51081.1 Taurine catabolism dioxygenase TauD, TfdA family [Acinetobacter kyonggiensis]
MPNVVLSNDFYANFKDWLEISNTPMEIYKNLLEKEDFMFLIDSLKKMLINEKFIVLQNTPFSTAKQLEAFVYFFGEYYGNIEYTGIKVDCSYTGCASHQLTLHNDDAIDLEKQPNIGFIQVITEDPVFDVENGIVVIRELIGKLKYDAPELLDELMTHEVSFRSLGINYESMDKKVIEIKKPILYLEDNQYKVRFDLDRIKYHYQSTNEIQAYSESKMIYDFLKHCNEIKKSIFLKKGDILIFDNKSTLHDRTECSIGIDIGSRIFSREIFVSFAI